MRENFDVPLNEKPEITARRINLTKQSGHHSVYDHSYITLCIEDAPKLLAMLLNNEKMYTTSEKSARYTKMAATGREKELYDKWLEIFKTQIDGAYGAEPYVVKAREKLAQENARYMTSVMTPMTMIHTVSYRQLNLLCGFAKKMLDGGAHPLAVLLKPTLADFISQIEATGFVDENLLYGTKNRSFTLFENDSTRKEVFSSVYSVNYRATFAIMAHLHRHRTLTYSFSLPKNPEFYVPELISGDPKLKAEWLDDIKSIAGAYPQGMLLNVNERGTVEDLILKAKDRNCTRAQLEICALTMSTMKRICAGADDETKKVLKPYLGMRCTFPDFVCNEKCTFPDGIRGSRKI
jgi:hypothetical protein